MSVNIGSDARRVRVSNRDEVGIVVDEGKNFGTTHNVYCAGVYFPSSGEVVFYEKSHLRPAEA